jgi:predicted ribosome quality control (RQC) complex YloA/Tae2 family protein
MNIRKYFEIKKKSYEKEKKTKTAANAAIKDAETNAVKEIVKHRQTQQKVGERMRKVFWFEKYDWFISSENYLIISGKNAQQNEALVKRYLNKGDLFMHTDMPGAAVTVIKNPQTEHPVPHMTLNEAAVFEVCHSRAWDAKIITEVYWVHADQVSKTPPTGLYISTGSFIIRGKRNFITPNKLELGFTLMFSLSPESIANHMGERKPRNQLNADEEDDLPPV